MSKLQGAGVLLARHRVAFDDAMFGIETPMGRTPLQGASLGVTSPRAKAAGLFC